MSSNPARYVFLLLLLGGCVRVGPPLPAQPSPVPSELDGPEDSTATVIQLDDLDLSALEPAPFEDAGTDSLANAEPLTALDLTGTGISLVLNERVQQWINIFTGTERERFALYLTRQGQYEEMIRSRLVDRGMPEDLLYLALIESGYSPIARSRARAVGMWQFMTATARQEGLIVNEFLDERRHVERSTDAALNHLTGLYKRYGSWYLAAAAYNSGPGRVDRALRARADGATGSDSLYWQIHPALPRETRDYVPKLVAATIIGRNRAAFGFDAVEPLLPTPLDRVMIPDATDFDVIAEAAGVTAEAITALNPHLPMAVTPPGRPVEILLPAGTGDAFQVAYAEIPVEKRVRFRTHFVRKGETLSAIAVRYGTSVRVIQDANRIRNAARISIGQELRIPGAATSSRSVAASPDASAATAPRTSGETETYRVRAGESIWTIARKKGVAWKDLLRWNQLTERSVIRPGDRLVIRYSSDGP